MMDTLLPIGFPFQKGCPKAGWPVPSLLVSPGAGAHWEQAALAHHMGNTPQVEKAAGQLSGSVLCTLGQKQNQNLTYKPARLLSHQPRDPNNTSLKSIDVKARSLLLI